MSLIIDKITSTDGSSNINVNQMIKYEDGLIKTIQGDVLVSLTETLEVINLTGDDEINISGYELTQAMENTGFFIVYQEQEQPNWNLYLMEVTCQLGEELPEITIETANGTKIMQSKSSSNNNFYFDKETINSEFIKITINPLQVGVIQSMKFDLWMGI